MGENRKPDQDQKPKMPQGQGFNWSAVILAVGAILLLQSWLSGAQQTTQIPYSKFERYLEDGVIKSVTVDDNTIRGEFTTPQNGSRQFVTRRVSDDLAQKLRDAGVEYEGTADPGWWVNLLGWMLPLLLIFGFWAFMLRRMSGGGGAGGGGGIGGLMSIGKSKAKIYVETDTKVGFDAVAGVDEAKEELQEIIEFLRDPAGYGRLGAHVPKGVLLVGPPGTGKTLLARAVAGEAEVPFYSISGSEFVEMFVGVGAARVRDLFQQARGQAPAIIFVDELDALGRARSPGGGPAGGGNDEREQTLNQLLSEMDGFDPSEGLVLIAATNRPEVLDPALLRAGRFDRQVLVDRPDKKGRAQILQVHMKKAKLGEDVDADKVAVLTAGFSGADLENLVNEAALLATRRGANAVEMEDFNNAIERIVAGLEKKNRLMNPNERKVIAYHEMGHALVSMALPGVEEVHKVSIIPRGVGALGYTIQRPTEDRFLMTRRELEDKIAKLLAGRAAEELVFGHLSTGASDDLAKVTEIARSMVTQYGMDEELGYIAYDNQRSSFLGQQETNNLNRQYSEATAERIDASVKQIVHDGFETAYGILRDNRDILESCAQALLEQETLTDEELKALTKGLKVREDRASGLSQPADERPEAAE